MSTSVRIELPYSLCVLAGAPREVLLPLVRPVTQRTVIDALESAYPTLRGTIRDQTSKRRRPFVRFFACQQDLSHMDVDEPLPQVVADGKEPFLVIGAVAGG